MATRRTRPARRWTTERTRSPPDRSARTLTPVTSPGQHDEQDDDHRDDHGEERHRGTGPLGSATAPADDPASGGAPDGPASGQAGPSWPPAETEPDAH